MTFLPWLFLLVAAGAVLTLPRRLAAIPVLAAACYVPSNVGLELASFSLPIYRVVLGFGLLRAAIRRETLVGGLNSIDRCMVAWSAWVLFASFFHLWEPGSGPKYASGYVMNIALSYFLIRAWCRGWEDAKELIKALAVLLVPVALGMTMEHMIHRNYFSAFGAPEGVYVRDGAIRSQGPFAHPILAGTVGSVCVVYMLAIWEEHRLLAIIGIASALSMVFASNSSGPLVSLIFAVGAVMAWRFRAWTRAFRYCAVFTYLVLEIVMSRPAYYVISMFDLTGSSTGWHRSRLIEAAIEHLPDWWLFGTDWTFNWMSAVSYSERHSDITNYYISIGVVAGLPAMFLTILMIWRSFRWVGTLVQGDDASKAQERFGAWCLGAGLFSHALSSLSVAYFDQSVVFFWMNISLISTLYSSAISQNIPTEAPRHIIAPSRPAV